MCAWRLFSWSVYATSNIWFNLCCIVIVKIWFVDMGCSLFSLQRWWSVISIHKCLSKSCFFLLRSSQQWITLFGIGGWVHDLRYNVYVLRCIETLDTGWVEMHLGQGDFGPFYPQIPVKVPLWLGIAMKKRSKCRIQPPDWMSVGEWRASNSFRLVLWATKHSSRVEPEN